MNKVMKAEVDLDVFYEIYWGKNKVFFFNAVFYQSVMNDIFTKNGYWAKYDYLLQTEVTWAIFHKYVCMYRYWLNQLL